MRSGASSSTIPTSRVTRAPTHARGRGRARSSPRTARPTRSGPPRSQFSTGEAVTAASFANAINRVASQELQSPGSSFIDIIQGADAALTGRAKTVSGVIAKGNTLTIKLLRPAPDLIARLAMPFFRDQPGARGRYRLPGVNTFASCGPYYVAADPERVDLAEAEHVYKGTRPHNVDQIEYRIGNSFQVIEQTSSRARPTSRPRVSPDSWKRLADKYGVNKGRVYIAPSLSVFYLAMNTSGRFSRTMCRSGRPSTTRSTGGRCSRSRVSERESAATRSCHRCSRRLQDQRDAVPAQGAEPEEGQRAREGPPRDGKAIIWTSNRGAAPLQAQIFQYNLKQSGSTSRCSRSHVASRSRGGRRGAPFDLTAEAWTADYRTRTTSSTSCSRATPAGREQQQLRVLQRSEVQHAIRNASKLTGSKRYSTYGSLDMEISKNAVPWATRPGATYRIFVSARPGVRALERYSFDLAAVCLK